MHCLNTTYPLSYYHNSFLETQRLGHNDVGLWYMGVPKSIYIKLPNRMCNVETKALKVYLYKQFFTTY